MNENDLNELRQIILDYEIACPLSGTRKPRTDVRQFNLMFSTEMGSTADGTMKIYLRPETAQEYFCQLSQCAESWSYAHSLRYCTNRQGIPQ